MTNTQPEAGNPPEPVQLQWIELDATENHPGYRIQIEIVDGRYAATEVVLWPPKGRAITRSMLHDMNIHEIVQDAVRGAEEDGGEDVQWPSLMERALAPLKEENITGTAKLEAVAKVYQLAKLQRIPLHQVAAELGVHKKTLQRWAQQAEADGFLSAEDRTW